MDYLDCERTGSLQALIIHLLLPYHTLQSMLLKLLEFLRMIILGEEFFYRFGKDVESETRV